MCGIFGLIVPPGTLVSYPVFEDICKQLFILSETRGRESAGLAATSASEKGIRIFRKPSAPSELIRMSGFKNIVQDCYGPMGNNSVPNPSAPACLIGHARLVTDGAQTTDTNNQPVIYNDLALVHNGIVVNDEVLWGEYDDLERHCEVDSEVIVALIDKLTQEGMPMDQAIREAFGMIKGAASIALMREKSSALALATNTGSLFLCKAQAVPLCFFVSELYIAQKIASNRRFRRVFGTCEIEQLKAGQGCLVDMEQCISGYFDLKQPEYIDLSGNLSVSQIGRSSTEKKSDQLLKIKKLSIDIPPLKRCTRCILPETIPFIEFDEQGVCNFCRNYTKKPVLGREELEKVVAPYRSKNGEPDCIVGLSGGRDSTYTLHYLKVELGMNPIAYTYDWGMVTDLARRNQSRICGRLGVEHILVSADIEKKRRYIQKNIKAWLQKPDLGLIPLFMAGDKQYFAYAHKVRKQTGIPLVMWCSNPRLENCMFKSGFAGINIGGRRVWDISLLEKIKIASYYGTAFLRNPAFLNESLKDTLVSFYWSWLVPHDFVFFFDYIPWDEKIIMDTLRREYEWEVDGGTTSTWRIGDGTAAFYNYIYYKVAGFTEHDTFRSNQVREGMLTRDEALSLVHEDNKPRYDSLAWYAETNNFDLDSALRVIDAIPPLYYSH